MKKQEKALTLNTQTPKTFKPQTQQHLTAMTRAKRAFFGRTLAPWQNLGRTLAALGPGHGKPPISIQVFWM